MLISSLASHPPRFFISNYVLTQLSFITESARCAHTDRETSSALQLGQALFCLQQDLPTSSIF